MATSGSVIDVCAGRAAPMDVQGERIITGFDKGAVHGRIQVTRDGLDIDDHADRLASGVRLPLRPFLGTIGAAPDVEGRSLPFPPHRAGGNIDTRHLVVGSVLRLPVQLPGGLISVGDPHASQGDGEVCSTALECSMRASLRFTLHRHSTSLPTFTSPPETGTRGQVAIMGISHDLYEGARIATRAMIAWLGEHHELEPASAYMLCSLAGDLRIFEVVDDGMWNVGMCIPLEIFEAT